MSENNKIKIKLLMVKNLDKYNKVIKNDAGEIDYEQYDSLALKRMLNAVNSKAIPVSEFATLLTLEGKVKNAWRQDAEGLELNIDESKFLKELLANPANSEMSYPLFYIRTIHAILEQMK